jgi:hypothetical protein
VADREKREGDEGRQGESGDCDEGGHAIPAESNPRAVPAHDISRVPAACYGVTAHPPMAGFRTGGPKHGLRLMAA